MNKKYIGKFKVNVALEVIKRYKTIFQIACEYSIHSLQVRNWDREFLTKSHLVFKRGKDTKKLQSGL